MGEAKRRGTKEARIEQSITRTQEEKRRKMELKYKEKEAAETKVEEAGQKIVLSTPRRNPKISMAAFALLAGLALVPPPQKKGK